MFNEKYKGRLEMFDISHIIILVVFLAIAVLIITYRDYFKKERPDKIFRYSVAGLSLALEITCHIWTASIGGYSVDMIPFLGLCSTVNLLTIIALVTDNKRIMEIIYFWALTGAFFSLIFVDISYAPIHFRFFHYFIVHYNFLLVAIYYVATGKITLSRKKLYISCAIIFSYSLLMLLLDVVLDKNWFYMLESPVKEVSDFFGAPWYSILWIIAIALMLNGWYYLTVLTIRLYGKRAKKGDNESKLNENGNKLNENGNKLNDNGNKLNENESKLNENEGKLNENESKLNENESKMPSSV